RDEQKMSANMKTNNQSEFTSSLGSRRNFAVRTVVASLALATATLSAVAAGGTASDEASTAIRPFHYHASDEALADLRRRINETRWPERELVADASQGVQLATMKELARYWVTDYDWRKCEAKLDALPQFVTTIDGVDIHFIHVRSKHENALPIIITHGW